MARIGNFSREVELLISRTLSPEARQKIAAREARKILAEAQAANARVLGKTPPHKEYVDGRLGAPLESVNPDMGHITFDFSLIGEMLEWVGRMLVENSPIGGPPDSPHDPHPGLYARSHILLADGVEVDVDNGKALPKAETYVFVNRVPYARRIERGWSDQTPEGVYEVVADIAKRRFGNIANIRFTFATIVGGDGELWDWAARNASKQPTARKQAAQYDKNVRNPAISITLR
jgi:hypothetical protein